LKDELGPRFIRVRIDSSPGNDAGIDTAAHSVLAKDFVDDDGSPTRAALDDVIGFLRQRLPPRPVSGAGTPTA
jgi:hypothetical protein